MSDLVGFILIMAAIVAPIFLFIFILIIREDIKNLKEQIHEIQAHKEITREISVGLEKRCMKLEKGLDFRFGDPIVQVAVFDGKYSGTNLIRQHRIQVCDAIKLIADHMGVKFDVQPESVRLVSKENK